MSEAQANRLPTNDKSKMGVESFNRFYDTDEGQALRPESNMNYSYSLYRESNKANFDNLIVDSFTRAEDRDEFPELFDNDSEPDDQTEDVDDRMDEDEVEEEEVQPDPREQISKNEQLQLRKIKGNKDQVEELDLANW